MKEKLLYVFLFLLFLAYVVVEQYAPKPLDWTPTFSEKDKNPYGGYILYERLEDFFDESKQVSFQTLYELRDSVGQILVISQNFEPSEQDIAALFQLLNTGRDVLIAAGSYSSLFLDSLGLDQEINYTPASVASSDSVKVILDEGTIYFMAPMVRSHFMVSEGWTVHAKTDFPVLISRHFGQGRVVLTTVPLAFTNYGLLYRDNYLFAQKALQVISDGTVIFNRYYQAGRGEPRTPLRYLLAQAPLRWALYLTLFMLVVLFIFGSRRKQRAIPLMDPKENTTLGYIRTIGGLYHREGNHKNVAEKIIRYFLKTISERYYISGFFTESSYQTLSAKTGLKKELVTETFELIRNIRSRKSISEEMLNNLQEKITSFNLN